MIGSQIAFHDKIKIDIYVLQNNSVMHTHYRQLRKELIIAFNYPDFLSSDI